MREPQKINGWKGHRNEIFDSEFDARKSLAQADLEELLRKATTSNVTRSWSELSAWLNENWDELVALKWAAETGFKPSEDEE